MTEASVLVSPIATDSVRSELDRRCPRWLQPVISLLSGCPRPGETPLVKFGTSELVAVEALALVCSTVVSSLPFLGYTWAFTLLPLMLCISIGRLRWFQTELGHYVSHGAENPRWGVVACIIVIAQYELDYKAEHRGLHHVIKKLATQVDPDYQVLERFGITPGVPDDELMRRLVHTLFSPNFHLWFLKSRLASNLIEPEQVSRRIASAVWILLIMSLGWVLPLAAWTTAVLFPITLGYQASALLQFASEHYWGVDVPDGERRAVALSHGRFCLDRPPATNTYLGWLRWTTRAIFLHLPARLAVLPGSLPAHDAHHVAERETVQNWQRATYVRSDLIAAGRDLGMAGREQWGGLGTALRAVFSAMAATKVNIDTNSGE